MTGLLLDLLDGKKGLALAAMAMIVGLLLPMALVVDCGSALRRVHVRRRVLAADAALCDGNHVVELANVAWRCEACGYPYLGHGFDRCPACSATCHRVSCSCSRALVNPLFADEEAR